MLLDSGSELNIMTLSQAHELSLPIDESGLSWTLRGISGHTMNLEGVCWDVPIKIGGLTFPHNFFVSKDGLGNKDMVLGQPWLFSQLSKIEYLHDIGMKIQLWEHGQKDGQSILISLPLIKAPRNVMSAMLSKTMYSRSGEVMLAQPGDDPMSEAVPKFWDVAEEALDDKRGSDPKKLRPEGLFEDLLREQGKGTSYFLEVVRTTWYANADRGSKMLNERIAQIVGEMDRDLQERTSSGARHKPVAKKVNPVSTMDPDSIVPEYRPICHKPCTATAHGCPTLLCTDLSHTHRPFRDHD